MTTAAGLRFESMRTDETRRVEKALVQAGFQQADAYRYNKVSIRIRVVDARFEGMSTDNRHAMVEPILDTLPEEIQQDILTLITFAPSEIQGTSNLRAAVRNLEFEEPEPSEL